MNRRLFAKQLLAASPFVIAPTAIFKIPKKLNILILGGTNFLGPAIVNAALDKGHNVDLFNRGITNPDIFPQLKHFKGDRSQGAEGYKSLDNRYWHIIIDTWSGNSAYVEDAAKYLQGATSHYLYTSSISVYKNFHEKNMDESAETVSLELAKDKWEYPENKYQSELFTQQYFPKAHTILRPGPIKGWRDTSNDLAYWLIKVMRGEKILGPGNGLDPLQFIDVKDVADYIVHCAERNIKGIYNTSGPLKNESLTWNELLETAQKRLNKEAEIMWNSTDFLKKHEVRPFDDMPLWLPKDTDPGFMSISSKKAIDTGLSYRPIEKTIKDIVKWFQIKYGEDFEFGKGTEASPGLARQKEEALLKMLS